MLAATAVGCATADPEVGPQEGLSPASNIPVADIDVASGRASRFLTDNVDAIDPLHLSTLAYLHRNFGIAELGDAALGAEAGLAAVEEGRAPRWEYGDTRQILGMARLVDPDRRTPPNRRPDSAEVEVLMSGLYCDVRPLTGDDADLWEKEARKGGYDATHVLLAAAWAREVGCELGVVDDAIDEAAAITEAEFEQRYLGVPKPADIDDLGLEQAVFIEYAGRQRVMTAEWVEAVLAAQRPDGGWALSPTGGGTFEDSHWHPTALALWALGLYARGVGGASWVQP